jgi:putative oxidoreductase
VTARDWIALRPVDRLRPAGPLAMRAFLAIFLLYMSQDNVFSAARMDEFARFLAANGFPAPALAAHLSVYAQFTAGILIALGLFTRWAAAVMVFHFAVAILGTHVGLPFRTYLEPLAMFSSSLSLFLHGPGPLALDNRLVRP